MGRVYRTYPATDCAEMEPAGLASEVGKITGNLGSDSLSSVRAMSAGHRKYKKYSAFEMDESTWLCLERASGDLPDLQLSVRHRRDVDE